MLQPENQNKKYDFLFADIDSGRIKIPKFQRDFVWTKDQTAKLIDSIIKGFPIGTFIFWKTNEDMRHIKDIGNIRLPDPPSGEPVSFVLDGQQRISSLYAVRKGIRFQKDGKEIDYHDISINLDMDPDGDDQVVSISPPENAAYITVHRLLNGTLTEFIRQYKEEHIEVIDIYKKRLTSYDFSTIVITNYPLDIACEVFTRINTGGTQLTLFEIMVAKTFDQERNFDLAEKCRILLDGNSQEKDLKDANYDTISESIILQCVAAYLLKQVRRKDILKISRDDFIDVWPTVIEGLFAAVDFVRTRLRIPVSQLLPYDALLIPLTYFFTKNFCRMPNAKMEKLLIQYFWWASLSNRYSSGVENKIAQDLERMNVILQDGIPSYRGEEVQLSLDDLRWRWFGVGDAFCKAILCLYTYFQPHSFNNDAIVTLDNSWLITSTSKNYHHFFPRSYLRNQGVPDWKANSVLNITIVDDHLNKRTIRSKAPSEYMLNFIDNNQNLFGTMKTHLIDDLDQFGVWDDNYEQFIEERGKRVLEEVKKRLEPNI
jgi:hypothetical protein